MNYRITVLRDRPHREFLEARRQDPVTRKPFVAGDRATLCANCLLPFLEASWKAIGARHCGQSNTIGVEAFDLPPQTPTEPDGDAGHDTDDDAATATTVSVPGLRPIPIELHKVPITLH